MGMDPARDRTATAASASIMAMSSDTPSSSMLARSDARVLQHKTETGRGVVNRTCHAMGKRTQPAGAGAQERSVVA